MNRNEYMKRVLPVISVLGEEKTDMIMDKIAAYLVSAGEDNEAAALNALGIPEVFARKFVHTDGAYDIPAFSREARSGEKQEGDQDKGGLFTHNEKMALKPKPVAQRADKYDRRASNGYDSKRTIILLSLLIITSPIWLCFMALFVLIAFVFTFVVTALLLMMTVGGLALTVFGAIRLVSILPVGLVMTGCGLLLLGLSGIAFMPLLRFSMKLLSSTVRDIIIFTKNSIRNACEARSEVGG